MIEELANPPWLELFARWNTLKPNWTQVGLQVEHGSHIYLFNKLQKELLKELIIL